MNDSSSWFAQYQCKDCGYNIVVTQSPKLDYWWYCSNKMCKNHPGEQTGDMESPTFLSKN